MYLGCGVKHQKVLVVQKGAHQDKANPCDHPSKLEEAVIWEKSGSNYKEENTWY
jgi:hypothetical protein